MNSEPEMSKILDQIKSAEDVKNLPVESLPKLADEIRDRIVEVMPVNGGHFGAGLGITDLTIALHRVFDFAEDQFILDVSHQCYPHKLLTGRNIDYDSIRIKGGPAGYTRPSESRYDWWMWAHAGSSISTALGQARGNRGTDKYAVAIIGDGSVFNGMAMEALNHWGDLLDEKLIVILNDNDMAIAPTVGGMSKHLKSIKKTAAEEGLYADGKGKDAHLGHFFESFGHKYIGPVDGHDINGMIELFDEIKREGRGAFVHVKTIKGKGHREAEKDQWKWHAVGGAKSPTPPKKEHSRIGSTPYTNIFVDAAIERARLDDTVEALTCAMPCGTGLRKFQAEFPDRFYDAGIAEQHAVAFAAGLTKSGKKAICAIYSTFLQRAYDQLFQEVALNNQPVVFCMDRAGIVGPDGATHNGCFDISYVRSLPRIQIMAPRDATELEDMLNMSLDANVPCAIRYPRTAVPVRELEFERQAKLELGRSETLRTGNHAAIVAYGSMVYPAMDAAELLAAEGIEVTVVNARFVRPMDKMMLEEVLTKHPIVFTVEENTINGGFGSACLEVAARNRWAADRLYPIGLASDFVEHGTRSEMLEEHGLDPVGLVKTMKSVFAKLQSDVERMIRDAEAF
ncbi:MAG: 1-deoxy-D-xylulose-5-phosphate synthase [Planctomycetota bacterium]|jgi:1-deoxy-D-xylulose-5-phosphate synthase